MKEEVEIWHGRVEELLADAEDCTAEGRESVAGKSANKSRQSGLQLREICNKMSVHVRKDPLELNTLQEAAFQGCESRRLSGNEALERQNRKPQRMTTEEQEEKDEPNALLDEM